MLVVALLAGPVLGLPGPAEATARTDRLAGPSRIDTAVVISRAAFPDAAVPDAAEAVYLARADVFADALAAGALTDGPILIVPSCGEVPPVVASEIARLGPSEVVALGGPAAVCDELLNTAAERRQRGGSPGRHASTRRTRSRSRRPTGTPRRSTSPTPPTRRTPSRRAR